MEYLLGELGRLQYENRKLRADRRRLTKSRDAWKDEAMGYRWYSRTPQGKLASVSPIRGAEAS